MTNHRPRWLRPGTGRLRPPAAPAAAADVELLRARLEALGLRQIARLRLTDNRSVMVSFSRRRVLSVHRVYAGAPDRVLRAIVRFVSAGVPRAQRKGAQREILAFRGTPRPEELAEPARRIARARPEDVPDVARLRELFGAYNARHFGGRLGAIPIRLSRRMRTRLGHLSLDRAGRPTEITISRRHLVAHGWDEVAHTLLHEMVHVWQHASGHAVDHGPAFRTKAHEVGAHAAARRWVRRGPARRRG